MTKYGAALWIARAARGECGNAEALARKLGEAARIMGLTCGECFDLAGIVGLDGWGLVAGLHRGYFGRHRGRK